MPNRRTRPGPCATHRGLVLVAEPERHADRRAPEVEVLKREIEVAGCRLAVAQLPEVAEVSAQPDVVVEVAVHATAEIEAPVIRRQVVEERATGDVAAQQPGATNDVRPQAAAGLAANRCADDDVAHQAGHVAVTKREITCAGGVLEEVR